MVLIHINKGNAGKLQRCYLRLLTETINRVTLMGLLSSLKNSRAARKALAAQSAYSTEYASWKATTDMFDAYIAIVRDCIEGRMNEQLVDRSDYGFMLNATEIPVAYLPLALFYEADEATDEGSAIVTTERILYSGALRTCEWKFSKMINIAHHLPGYSIFSTAGAGSPTGIAYGPDVATEVQFRIELAAAIARDRLSQFLAELEGHKAQHLAKMPVPPAPTTPA